MNEYKTKLAGKTWKIIHKAYFPDNAWGECNHDTRTIKINALASGKMRLDAITHELLHAILPNHDEEWVDNISAEIMEALWKCNVRVIEEG